MKERVTLELKDYNHMKEKIVELKELLGKKVVYDQSITSVSGHSGSIYNKLIYTNDDATQRIVSQLAYNEKYRKDSIEIIRKLKSFFGLVITTKSKLKP